MSQPGCSDATLLCLLTFTIVSQAPRMQYQLIGCLAGALHASVNVSFVELGLARQIRDSISFLSGLVEVLLASSGQAAEDRARLGGEVIQSRPKRLLSVVALSPQRRDRSFFIAVPCPSVAGKRHKVATSGRAASW
jgi:hypothetical protein